jgi:5-methyltetrahydrofolate--homocysteine methyltransferase
MAVGDIYMAVLDYNIDKIVGLVQKEMECGTDTSRILNEGLISPMDEVGKRFSLGEIFVPEMLIAAKVMQSGLETLKPHLLKAETESKGTIVMGTVKGDLHDIGKNIVIMMLEAGGFNVADLGVDVNAERFVDAVKKHDARVVALSALLTITMSTMEETVSVLRRETPEVKIMIGGAPVNQEFADRIGVDGYGEDAPSAVRLARKFVSDQRQSSQHQI